MGADHPRRLHVAVQSLVSLSVAAADEQTGVTEESQGSFRVEVHGVKQTTTHMVRVTPEMVAGLGWPGTAADQSS